jgi:hypothetical protein
MKKYQRATKNELESFLIRNNQIKIQPELFDDIYSMDGKVITPDSISRKNELTGAGIEYVTSYIEYVCTHYKSSISRANNNYYEAPAIQWAAFLDIITGGISGQRDRAAREILKLHASPKPVLIRRNNNHMVSMQPFVIIFDWRNRETIGARAAAKLDKMQEGVNKLAIKREFVRAKRENRKIDINNVIYPELLPIETITIQFSKPLFEDFFRSGAGSYSFPVGMYAKIFKMATDMKSSLKAMKEDGHYITDEEMNIDHEAHISAYTRFTRYIMLHNNLTKKELKDKDHYSPLSFDIKKTLDFLSSVYPSAIYMNGRRERHVDMPKFTQFMSSAIALYRATPNFLLYPVLEHIDRKGFRLGIYTTMEAANKADTDKSLKMSPKK